MLENYLGFEAEAIYKVGNNEAWGLVESGKATYELRKRVRKTRKKQIRGKRTRMMTASKSKLYKTK